MREFRKSDPLRTKVKIRFTFVLCLWVDRTQNLYREWQELLPVEAIVSTRHHLTDRDRNVVAAFMSDPVGHNQHASQKNGFLFLNVVVLDVHGRSRTPGAIGVGLPLAK